MALTISADLQRFKHENEMLRSENERLRDSKLALIIATSQEIERLRQFIHLLAKALRGSGFTRNNIRQIERSVKSSSSSNNKNHSIKRKAPSEWSYKKKKPKNNIKSDWYSKESIAKMVCSLCIYNMVLF